MSCLSMGRPSFPQSPPCWKTGMSQQSWTILFTSFEESDQAPAAKSAPLAKMSYRTTDLRIDARGGKVRVRGVAIFRRKTTTGAGLGFAVS